MTRMAHFLLFGLIVTKVSSSCPAATPGALSPRFVETPTHHLTEDQKNVKEKYDEFSIIINDVPDDLKEVEEEAWDPEFHQGLVTPPEALIKIPNRDFWSINGKPPAYKSKLDPNQYYVFGVSMFDPYVLRCFREKLSDKFIAPIIGTPKTVLALTGGHTAVYNEEEWYDCITNQQPKKAENQRVKYAGYFKTGNDGSIVKWNNWSGHILPPWSHEFKTMWEQFWNWKGGMDWEQGGAGTDFARIRDANVYEHYDNFDDEMIYDKALLNLRRARQQFVIAQQMVRNEKNTRQNHRGGQLLMRYAGH